MSSSPAPPMKSNEDQNPPAVTEEQDATQALEPLNNTEQTESTHQGDSRGEGGILAKQELREDNDVIAKNSGQDEKPLEREVPRVEEPNKTEKDALDLETGKSSTRTQNEDAEEEKLLPGLGSGFTLPPPKETTPEQTVSSRPISPPPEAELSEKDLSEKAPVSSPSPPPPPPKDDKYQETQSLPIRLPPLDVNVKATTTSNGIRQESDNEKAEGSEEQQDDSQSEIQSIMEQFDEGMDAPGMEEIMSPRLDIAGPRHGSPVTQHPPRKSSLEPLQASTMAQFSDQSTGSKQPIQSPPLRTSSISSVPPPSNEKSSKPDSVSSPKSNSIFKPPPPDPESDLPFDFHRFLEQLRHRTADPVARFLRSFLSEFGKKQWMVHEQVKIISDFLEFISKKMAQCEVWRTVSDAEFDNAKEGMEKLVMNRLYSQTFSPAIPPPEPSLKGRRRAPQNPDAPGRKGQHQEDVERDEVLAQKVRIYKWVNESHLDIPPIGDKGRKFLQLAQQELLKITSYRAPRDKVICVLNCCKVIFGFLRNQQTDTSADSFVPLLIYTVLQANPEHLVSNVQYILRFRHQDKLNGEAGYYMSSLMGAVQFIENLDRTTLTISDEEFEKNVEAAVSAIAERHNAEEEELREQERQMAARSEQQASISTAMRSPGHQRRASPHVHVSEKSSLAIAEVTTRNSLDAEHVPPRRSTSLRTQNQPPPANINATASSSSSTDVDSDENAAVAGLLRTIRSPLSTIGRIFSDDPSPPPQQYQQYQQHPALTPQPGSTPARLSPAAAAAAAGTPSAPRRSTSSDEPRARSTHNHQQNQQQNIQHIQRMSAEDAAARQASAETEQARKLQAKEHRDVVETLAGMFPILDREVIDDVVRVKQGRVGLAVDACLALASTS